MSLTCHEEIGRVGRECYEDASDVSATSRACRARGIWRTTRHTDKQAAPAPYTAADCRPTNQVRVRQAEQGSRPTRQTRATSSYNPREDVGRVNEDVTRMLRRSYEETKHKREMYILHLALIISITYAKYFHIRPKPTSFMSFISSHLISSGLISTILSAL